jgi:hypothetical protein
MQEQEKPDIAGGAMSGSTRKAARRRGRPAVHIDLTEVEKLASIQATDEEIADFFDVTRRTLTRKKQQPEFRRALERGKAKGRIALRRRLFQLAQAGNVAAAIFLGKNLLGYRDNPLPVPEERKEPTAQEKFEAVQMMREAYGLERETWPPQENIVRADFSTPGHAPGAEAPCLIYANSRAERTR